MKNKARWVSRTRELAENRANACQVPGRSASVSCTIRALFGSVVLLIVIAG